MAFLPPTYDKSDPKTPEAPIVPFHLPKDWAETTDMYVSPARVREKEGDADDDMCGRFSSSSTVVAGFAMMSRNSYVPQGCGHSRQIADRSPPPQSPSRALPLLVPAIR